MGFSNLQFNKKIILIFSVITLFGMISTVGLQDIDAVKSKGTSLPETGSKKVCGDKLCSESSDQEKQKYQKSEIIVDNSIEMSDSKGKITQLESRIVELEEELMKYKEAEDLVQRNLDTFDELDLVAFNNRDMERIAEIHAPDVRVINPDGTVTTPYYPDHEDELAFLFHIFPDFSINEHPIGFGQGNWTAGLSISTGTFFNPMELPDGTVIEPTGKSYEVRVVTLANWEDGRIVEEYLIWDNQDWMSQIGVKGSKLITSNSD